MDLYYCRKVSKTSLNFNTVSINNYVKPAQSDEYEN